MRKLVALATLLVAASIVLAGLTSSDPLANSAQALHAAKTLSATFTAQRIGGVAMTYQADLAKPNKARIESENQIIVADGSSIIVYNKGDKTFEKRTQNEAETKALFSSKETVLLGAFFDPGFSSRFGTVSSLGKKSRRGVAYDAVSATSNGSTFTFYLDPADKIAKLAEIAAKDSGDASGTMIVAIKDFQPDAKLDDARFAFTPPADATNISADAPLKFPRTSMPNLYGWKVLPEVGEHSCCPTATADGLAFLSMNGPDGLAPAGSATERAEWLAHELSTKYYKTDNVIGTTWDKMFAGLPAFLSDRGYRNSTLSLYSWTTNSTWGIKQLGTELPDLETIKQGNTRNGIVMLALGWFNNPDAGGKCSRDNWHWVTVTDVNPAEGTVTICDPFQKGNPTAKQLTLRYTKLPASTNIVLAGSSQFRTPDKPAAGVPVLEKYPNVKTSQFAIVEGVLFVKVAK
jgi:outer membrane lipoprotein-sorting protein